MNKIVKKVLLVAATVICSLLIPISAKADVCYKEECTMEQPDKSEVKVVVSGDEFYKHIESNDGYTLTRNDEGWICYAKLNEDKSNLIATDKIYTGETSEVSMLSDNYDDTSDVIEKHISIDEEEINKIVEERKNNFVEKESIKINNFSLKARNSGAEEIKGLTVLVNFPDMPATKTLGEINDLMNKAGYNKNSNNGSVRDYFKDISNGSIDYTNKVVGYYTAKHNRAYYDKDTVISSNRIRYKSQDLVEEIINWIKESKVDVSGVTLNDDGSFKVLNVLFVGERATQSVTDIGLWPHCHYLDCNGGRQKYTVVNMGQKLTIGTICHENGHALLGYDDLYRLNGEGDIIGSYCLMGGGSHVDDGKNPPPPNPYLRNEVSHFRVSKNLNDVADSTTITLNASGTGNQDVYKWINPLNEKEYYLIENISKINRYSGLYEDGLVIWKVNANGSNKDTPTGADISRYLIYFIAADNYNEFITGKYNGSSSGDNFFSALNPQFSDSTTPSAKWLNGTNSGLKLTNISPKGKTMTFVKGGQQKVGWSSFGDTWYYYNTDGTAKTGWLQENGEWYYFDNKGVMQTKWVNDNGTWYYFNPVSDGTRGVMKTGWIQDNGKWYYLNPVSDGTRGAMKTGWLNDNGKWYYLDDNTGEMLTNTIIEGYTIGSDGVCID